MPQIIREDGERFIIPSYRDILSAKKPSLLKKEILLLSGNYGDYITLRRKNADQYEAAFSNEPGNLLGETIWSYFKNPLDMIYCEAIPNSSEAILVIVKSGSVWLDGSFPIDSIADELVIFRPQTNNFEIYIYGDVPLSEKPEEDKFSFDAKSIKSFTVLPEPVFPTLPIVKAYQLNPAEAVLRGQGIGVFPIKKIAVGTGVILVVGLIFQYFLTHQEKAPDIFVQTINPWQAYLSELTTPNPTNEISAIIKKIMELYTVPGWMPEKVVYQQGNFAAKMKSAGMKTAILFQWASSHNTTVEIMPDGVHVNTRIKTPVRQPTLNVMPLQRVIGQVIDRISTVMPGNMITLTPSEKNGPYNQSKIIINFTSISPATLEIIARQLQNLPLNLLKTEITIQNGMLSGSITLQALGS